MTLLLYGATGYTGELIAREAVQRGMKPILAGRRRDAVAALAAELELEHRGFGLERAEDIDTGLVGVQAVLHCAGPFAHTYRAMADACLRRRVHYLDITGEIAVFEGLAARDQEAKQAGIMLMPGVGFDVVPSDCLAAHLKLRLPSATHLTLAIHSFARTSRGTAATAIENLPRGGAVRQDGRLVAIPAAGRSRTIDFGNGPVQTVTIPWGDVVTAYHSTGIPNIEVYLATTPAMRRFMRWSWLLAPRPCQWLLKQLVRWGPPGPTAEQRAAGKIILWGEAHDTAGGRVVSRLHCPEGYIATAQSALAVAERVLQGEAPPGFHTPAQVFGPDFVLELPGFRREDVDG